MDIKLPNKPWVRGKFRTRVYLAVPRKTAVQVQLLESDGQFPRINQWLKLLEFAVLIIGIIIAWRSYSEYKAQNALAAVAQLNETERSIGQMVLQYPVTDAMWVQVDKSLHGKARADSLLLSAFAPNGKCTAEMPKDKKIDPECDFDQLKKWNSMADLSEVMWSKKTLHRKYIIELRQVYMLAETILYYIIEAMDLEAKGLLSKNEANTYRAYINNIGSHPLFLQAVWYGHKNSYYTRDVAIKLKHEILANPGGHEMVNEVFKELLAPCWAFQIPAE